MAKVETRELTTLRFDGPRFEDHGLEIDVLPELIAYKKILLETTKERFFDVSNGIEEVSERGCDQIDHGHEGGGVSVSASPCPGGLEEAVEALQTGVVMG